MFTFGDFKHELDYILKNDFENVILAQHLKKINNKESIIINPMKEKKITKKSWNKISIVVKSTTIINYLGIQNYENCCFLNASLQVLLNNSDFMSSLNLYEGRTSGSSEIIETLLKYRDEMKPSIVDLVINKADDSITYFGNRLPTIGPCLSLVSLLGFIKNQHEDAEEFITKLLTQVHEDLLTCDFTYHDDGVNDVSATVDDWVEIGKGGKNMCAGREDGGDMSTETVLSQLLSGKITEKVTKKGTSKNATITPFFILPLNIQSEDIVDVVSALLNLTKTEKLQNWTERQMQISQLPSMLILQMKRFTYTKHVGTEKITKYIKINDFLTIPEECLHSTIKGSSDCKYQLYAVVFHIGQGVLKGHYTAAIRSDNDSWMYIDDCHVMKVQGPKSCQWLLSSDDASIPSQLLSLDIRTNAPQRSCVNGPRTPYLLFYSRI